MGAGRGGLSLSTAVHPALEGKAHVVMVDRGRFRNKADTALRKMESEQSPTIQSWDRMYCDITDFWMPGACFAAKVNSEQSGVARADSAAGQPTKLSSSAEAATAPAGMVVTAKHLCGGGTDVALRALQHAQAGAELYPKTASPASLAAAAAAPAAGDNNSIPAFVASGTAVPPLVGLVMATCCHHGCAWATYVGTHWWQAVAKLSPIHFAVAAWASSWQAGSWSSVLHQISGTSHQASDAHAWLQQMPVPSVQTLQKAVHKAAGSCDTSGQMPAELGGAADAHSWQQQPAVSALTSGVPSSDVSEHKLAPSASQAALGAIANELSINDVHKLYIGRVCKRLIDEGRVHFTSETLRCAARVQAPPSSSSAPLVQDLSHARIQKTAGGQMCYCSGHLTLENVALVAHGCNAAVLPV